MTNKIEDILHDIDVEREAQDEEWGGPQHDDLHSSHDWIALITKHLGKAVMYPWNGAVFRNQMVRIAALAVAAISWYDRNFSSEEVKNNVSGD